MEIFPRHSESGIVPARPAKRDRPRVMVADDDPVIRYVLAGALNRHGFDAETFGSGPEALEAFDRLEVDMAAAGRLTPDLDGLSLIGRLKAKAPNLPAVFITGDARDARARAACEKGLIDAVILKPFNIKDFLDTVRHFLGLGRGAGGAAPPPAAMDRLKTELADSWKLFVGRESFFEQIFQSLIDAVIMVDAEGRIIHYNRGAARMFGFRPGPAASHMLADYCPAGSPLPLTIPKFFQPHHPVEEQSEAFFRRAGGEEFYAVFSVSMFEPACQEPALLLLIKDVNDRRLVERRVAEKTRDLELLAITDPLTGLYNRRYFDHKLAEEFRRMERYKAPLSLIMIDFDHFKNINDTFGHLAGDKVLSAAALELKRALRDVDTLARWGGEEFMALLPETGEETALMAARRLHRRINDSGRWADIAEGLELTISLGLVSLPWKTARMSLTRVIDVLDKTLYQAKEQGRNQIIRYLDSRDAFETV